MARTRGRLMPLLVVLTAFVAGFVFPAHNEQHVAVIDVRQSPTPGSRCAPEFPPATASPSSSRSRTCSRR